MCGPLFLISSSQAQSHCFTSGLIRLGSDVFYTGDNVKPYSAGIDIRRHNLTSKVDLRTVRVKDL